MCDSSRKTIPSMEIFRREQSSVDYISRRPASRRLTRNGILPGWQAAPGLAGPFSATSRCRRQAVLSEESYAAGGSEKPALSYNLARQVFLGQSLFLEGGCTDFSR